MGVICNLKKVRVGYLNCFERAADSTNNAGETIRGKYQVTVYIDPDDKKNIRRVMDAARGALEERITKPELVERFMEKRVGFGQHDAQSCINDLAERDNPIEGLEEGLYFIARSNKQPKIYTSEMELQTKKGVTEVKDEDGEKEVVEIDGKEVYSGCYANVSVEFYYLDTYKKLYADFKGIKFAKDGESFGGGGTQVTADDLADDDDEEDSKPKKKLLKRRHEDDDE